MVMTYTQPERFILVRNGRCFGGLSLHNTGCMQSAQLHIFETTPSACIKFCTKRAAQALVTALKHHGINGWTVAKD